MVVLLVFVGYWNVSTYLREKKKLKEDVEIQLQLAFTEIKDSELVYFIRTQLVNEDGSKGFPDSISLYLHDTPLWPLIQTKDSNSFRFDSLITEYKEDSSLVIDIQYDTTNFPGRLDGKESSELTVIAASGVSSVLINEMELEGDSTIVDFKLRRFEKPGHFKPKNKRFSDSSHFGSWLKIEEKIHSDSLKRFSQDTIRKAYNYFDLTMEEAENSSDRTYALFKNKLTDAGLPSTFAVLSNSEEPAKGLKINYESGGFSFSDWTIDLLKYQSYILQKMIPTMLFSLFLLGIIGLAFWTLIRNWIRQNRLVLVKNEFINNMTHELKTPLATVGVALEAVSNFDLEKEKEKAREYIDISRNEINRLSLLVDKVLNIAAFDSQESPLSVENVNLSEIIEENINTLQFQIKEKEAVIEFADNTKNALTLGDRLHLGNVVHNILDNALKYSSSNPEISIALNQTPDHYVLTFSDNGQGISREYQDKIFDKFFRVPSDDLHDVKGHGLGLNYVKNIIEAHNGKISVESKLGVGSTFTIHLPKLVAHA